MSKDYEPDDKMKAKLAAFQDFSDFKERAQILQEEFGRTSKYMTGWAKFDTYLGGGFGSEHRGELVIVVGETAVGKTTFLANLALRILSNSGNALHYISLENPTEDIYNSMCEVAGKTDLDTLRGRLTSPTEKLIFDDGGWQCEDLLFHMQHIALARGVRLFVVDHLNFMFETEAQAEKEIIRIRVIMRKLSRFCMKNKACVFAISHANRNKSANDSHGMTNDRIYGSTAIAQAATKVLMLAESNDSSDKKRLVDIRMTKSRYTRRYRQHVVQFDATNYNWRCEGWKTI